MLVQQLKDVINDLDLSLGEERQKAGVSSQSIDKDVCCPFLLASMGTNPRE
jgi:hypothetical protein